MLKTVRNALRKVTHGTWIQIQESTAIMTGTPIEMDWRDTGDNYAPSPAVREGYVREDVTIHETETVHQRRRA